MKTLYRLYEFLFDRWVVTIERRGLETWITRSNVYGMETAAHEYKRNFIEYRYKNKFDGSEKIVRKYLN